MSSPSAALLACAALSLTPQPCTAQTVFTDALGDGDFNAPANWSAGLPASGNDGSIENGLTATLTSDFVLGSGNAWLHVGTNGTAGGLVVPPALHLDKGSGGKDVRVGVGAGSVGDVLVGGTLSVKGAGADLFLGDSAGGSGALTVASTGFLDARKSIVVTDGRLTLEPGATTGILKDALTFGPKGTLAFRTEGAAIGTFTYVAATSNTRILDLLDVAQLDLALEGEWVLGDSWALIRGYATRNGKFATGDTYTNSEGLAFVLNYDTGPNLDEVTATLTAAPLAGSPSELSLASGGVQTLSIGVGAAYTNDLYLLLGTTSGTSPGFPAGGLTLPLNFDAYLSYTLTSPNQAPLSASFALLDMNGGGTATLTIPAGSNPAFAGVLIHHAAIVLKIDPLGNLTTPVVTNAAPLRFIP